MTRRRAFTLMELLVAIAIVGFLAAITLVVVDVGRGKGRDSRRLSDLQQLRKALELGFNETSYYPPTTMAGYAIGNGTKSVLCTQGSVLDFKADESVANCDPGKVLMGNVPSDPISTLSYVYKLPSGGSSGTHYCIQTALEHGGGDYAAGPIYADNDSIKQGACP